MGCKLPDAIVPSGIALKTVEKNTVAEVNNVYRCEGKRNGRPISFYLKVSRNGKRNMGNEYRALELLRERGLPVPRVLWSGEGPQEYMALEEVRGTVLRELLNPKSESYSRALKTRYLRKYGEALARIHSVDVDWQPQKRSNFYDFLGEQRLPDLRYRELVIWLEANPISDRDYCFVHGDLNTANVIFSRGEVSGLLDWEYAGKGWREYDLAWILRAERTYLNTDEERNAVLEGYSSVASYDPEALRWCEVMNYLHVAYLSRDRMPGYEEFALEKGREISFKGFE
jgi:aminoglycoside phosphotransferase (APT) family kinase protein